jgi:hypothetical protein
MSLSQILSSQWSTAVSHELKPILPWNSENPDRVARERVRLLIANAGSEIGGDVASYYLNYVDEMIRCHPNLRVICLRDLPAAPEIGDDR